MRKLFVLLFIICISNMQPIKINADNEINIQEIIGQDIYQTSVKISQECFKESSETIILVSDNSDVDATISIPLAKAHNAPILVINKDNIPQTINEEIKRLNPKNVILIGGEATISKDIIQEINQIIKASNITRIGGNNRYETSLMIAKNIDEKINVEEVYIGNGSSTPDLLSIASVAGNECKPIILCSNNKIDKDMYDWLSSKKLKSSYFVGGTVSVSNAIVNEVNKITTEDVSKNRVSGSNRYETNVNIINKFYSNDLENIVLTNGDDILSATLGALLGSNINCPIFLIKDELDLSQVNLLDKVKIDNLYKVGNSINDYIFKEIYDRIAFNNIEKGEHVVFFIPHQDDEMLSFSTVLKRYIDKGCDVKVVLMANGSKSIARDVLNGERFCRIHNCFHNPLDEGYKIEDDNVEYIDESILIDYRNKEFYSALNVLGISNEDIYLSEFIVDDNELSEEIAINAMTKILDKYPNSRVHTFYYEDYYDENHVDHVAVGKAAKKLYDDGVIHEVYFHIEPYVYDDYALSGNNEGMHTYYSNNIYNENIIKNALKEYMLWDPQNGKLGIGYHSVKNYFDDAMKKPVNYIINEGIL